MLAFIWFFAGFRDLAIAAIGRAPGRAPTIVMLQVAVWPGAENNDGLATG